VASAILAAIVGCDDRHIKTATRLHVLWRPWDAWPLRAIDNTDIKHTIKHFE